MKGIILAGGNGTRLYPITKSISKQLLPVFDKPMIYYPLSILMKAGIKEILIISTPLDLPSFKKLLGDGSQLGINLVYKKQKSPDGLAQAFIIGEEFIGNDDVCMILGDNIFHGPELSSILKKSIKKTINDKVATIFGYYVKDPKRYGVCEFNSKGEVLSIIEKPTNPKSNFAVVGLYFYPNNVIEIAKKVRPSKRGELEITSINQEYLSNKNLRIEILGREYTWLDTGTHKSLYEASKFIQVLEDRQGLKIGCIEEISFMMGYISKSQLNKLIMEIKNSDYGKYLIERANNLGRD